MPRVTSIQAVAVLSIVAAAMVLAAGRLRAEPEARVIAITAKRFEFVEMDLPAELD